MDAELNEIMARDDKEYELFQKMDQERYEREGQEERIKHVQKNLNLDRFPSSFNYRLIQDFEVPEWIQQSAKEQVPEELGEFGLGKRKRAEVTYKEELSEGAWTRMIEAGLDPQQEVEKRKREGLPLDLSDLPKEQQASDRFVSD